LIESGPFEALAEFGVALAGFTGVVVVFGRQGELLLVDRFRVLNALVFSLGGAFLALLPLGLQLTELAPESLWRLSSAVLALVVGIQIAVTVTNARHLSPDDREVFRPFVAYALLGVFVVSLVLGGLNATGLWFRPQASAHFGAVLCLLFAAAVIFVRIVFIRPASESRGP
jgi:NO-binding membrane sensor protein with MHYT domain